MAQLISRFYTLALYYSILLLADTVILYSVSHYHISLLVKFNSSRPTVALVIWSLPTFLTLLSLPTSASLSLLRYTKLVPHQGLRPCSSLCLERTSPRSLMSHSLTPSGSLLSVTCCELTFWIVPSKIATLPHHSPFSYISLVFFISLILTWYIMYLFVCLSKI